MRIIFLISIVLTSTILNSQDYFSNRLFVKLKEDYKSNYALDKDARLRILLYPSEIVSAKPVSIHPLLNSTFELILDKDANLDSLILQLNQFPEIDFAEKVPLYKLFFTPNDPLYSSQWNLSKIQADLAWNLSQGCTNVKVAVTDDGFLLTHEDLVNQWHINSGEIAGNGIDDDANGYIDDWRGWDAANNDNDPSATAPTNSFFTHGTHVAGIVAAQTHNSKGIASMGYNCKMIPVKIGSSPSSTLTGAFQGLDYAINASGCDVINMSWGGGGKSATYQTLFNIAKSKGIICVAAAGNSNSSADMYPASYNHVISVAASASTDIRAWFSNYGSTIDVTAPGVDIQSCLAGATNSYGLMSGTSMASPLVAGLCGLMKCYNPMPADSIEACLKRTCDNIAAQNPILKDSLGAGRINAFQALQCLTKKPKSDFITLDTFQCIGKSVRYIAKSFGIPTMTYSWSFLGGTPSTSISTNPFVTYAANGLKSATLITCNSLGCDTITKTNYVNIDTPKAWLTNRKYTSYSANPVYITVHFTGNSPYYFTLTDGTNNFTQTNIRSNPYFFSIIPKKDTNLISISSFSDSLCVGNRYGMDTVYRITLSGGGSFDCDTTNLNIGKVLHLDFNGNTQDKSGNGNHATNYGATPAAGKDGIANTAYRFDGVNDYMKVANSTSLNNFSGNKITMTAILKPRGFYNGTCKGNSIIMKGNTDYQTGNYLLRYSPNNGCNASADTNQNNFYGSFSSSGGCSLSHIHNPPYVKRDTWYCLVVVYTGDSIHTYINGEKKYSCSYSGIIGSHNLDVFIGKLDNATYPYWLNADVDDIRIYNRVLNPSEIKGYCGTCTNSEKCIFIANDTCMVKDAVVASNFPNSNMGNHPEYFGSSWTCSGSPCNIRSYINFNLSQIPINGVVTSAKLYLKALPAGTAGNGYSGQPTFGTNNSCTIRRVTQSWGEYTVTWNNKPATTNQNEVTLAQSSSSFQNYEVNMLNLIKDQLANPSTSFGFELKHIAEGTSLNSMIFGSSDHSIDSLRPRLEICYFVPNGQPIFNPKPAECDTKDCDTINLNTGKVLHLDFNGNTQDKSGNGNHATNYGATAVAGKDGVANTAYKFDGVNDYMKVLNSTSLGMNSAYTVTCKIKIDGWNTATCHGNMIFFKGNTAPSAGNQHIDWVYAPNAFNGGCIPTLDTLHQNLLPASVTAPSPTAYTPYLNSGKWYCFAVVQKTDTLYNFIDGIMVYKTPNTGTGSNPYDIFIGKSNYASYPYWLNATIDDIRVYNRSLAPSEVKGYCGTCNVSPPNCNHWLKSINSSDRVTIGDLDIIGNKVTVEALVIQQDTFSGTLDEREIVSKHSTPADVNYTIRANHGYITTTNGFFATPPSCYNVLNKSYHIAMVYDGTSLKYYRNGFLMSQVAATGSLITNNYQTTIGNYAAINNLPTKGFINEVRIWNVARTQSQIQTFMNTSLPNPTTQTGLLGYYTFDNLLNKQGNAAYNGTLGGSAQINQTNPNCSLIIDSCGINISHPPCDTAKKYTFTQCLNDSIQVMARMGSKYQWSPSTGLSNDTIRNPKVFVTNNQRYLVSYTSLKNCQLIDTIDIEVKAAAVYPKMDDQLICIGDSVQMTIPIYATSIVWSPNSAISSTSSKNPFFFPTTPTTYYLEFRDTFGCLHRDTFVVNTKVCCPARARFTIPKDLLCFGETLAITNTSKGPITSYNWNFSTAIPNTFTGANPPILTFPSGGSYTLRLIVTNGSCQDTMVKTVTVVQIIPNAGKDTFNCLGAFTVQLGESPISDWTYSWTPTKFLSDPNIANPICNIVNDSVNYILEITDRSSGCKARDTVMVYTNRTIASKTTKQRICFGDSVLFNSSYRKSTNLYYYTIKKADGICDSFIDILDLNVLQKQILIYSDPASPYCEFYIDSKGKRHDTSYIERDTIRSKSLPNCDSIINITPREIFKKIYKEKTVQGCSPLRYNGKTYLVSKMKVDSIRIRGAYSGCDSIIEYINVIVYPKPKAEITPSIPNPVMYKQTVTLTASGGQTYLWLQTGSTNSEIDYKINNTQPKLYTVRVTDENDCWDTISYKIIGKLPDTCFYGFPNVFSPNQDNLNDEYIPNMDECTEIKVFAIYDRWGEKVFETNQQKGWNGSYKGKPAPMAVYLYYAELITPWGVKIHKGTFTLIR